MSSLRPLAEVEEPVATLLQALHDMYVLDTRGPLDDGAVYQDTPDWQWEQTTRFILAIVARDLPQNVRVCQRPGCFQAYQVTRSRGRPRKYCSTACNHATFKASFLPVPLPVPEGTQCGSCLEDIPITDLGYASQRRVRDGLPVYCSKRCSGTANGAARWAAEKERR